MDQSETQIKKKGGSFDADVWLFCDLASLPRSLVIWAQNSILSMMDSNDDISNGCYNNSIICDHDPDSLLQTGMITLRGVTLQCRLTAMARQDKPRR